MRTAVKMIVPCLLLMVVSGGNAIEPDSSRIATGQFEYRTTLEVGDTIVDIDSVRRLAWGENENSSRLLIETVTHTGMGPTEDHLELDAETLLPVRREVRQGDGHMAINFADDRVTGYIRAAGQTVSVDLALEQPAFAGESGLEALLAALPLRDGLETRLNILEIDVNTRLRHFDMQVGPVEIVEVPAGSFSAWPVHLTAADEFDDKQTIWISEDAPHIFIRAEAPVPAEMGGGALVTRLMSTSD